MKQFYVSFTSSYTRHDKIITIEKELELMLGDNTNFSDIVFFIDEIKKIHKKCIRCVKNGYDFQLTIEEWSPELFNRWVSEPVSKQDLDGVYLSADTRYTPMERDMYLTSDILHDLEFTLH